MRRPSASSLVGLLVSVVSLGAVVWWVARQDAPRLPDSAAGFAWLGAALAVIACNFALRGWRWHRIMRYAAIPHRTRDAFGLTLVGYMGNNVLPARGGELLKIGILGARTSARRREVLGTVVVERALDAAVLAALFVVLTWAGVEGSAGGEGTAALAAAALAAAAIGLAVYLRLRRGGRFERFAAAIRPVARASKLFARREGVPLGALSLLIWGLDGFSFMLIGRSLGIGLDPLAAMGVIVLASLAAAVPAAPGYLGTFDAALLLGLNAAGVEGGSAVGVLLLARFMYFVPVTIAGLGTLVVGYGASRGRAGQAGEPRRAPAPPEAELVAGSRRGA
jgi:glycosyltransferase 2 family protein